jgi:hypothetical protein
LPYDEWSNLGEREREREREREEERESEIERRENKGRENQGRRGAAAWRMPSNALPYRAPLAETCTACVISQHTPYVTRPAPHTADVSAAYGIAQQRRFVVRGLVLIH